jgi:hypothetical protein
MNRCAVLPVWLYKTRHMVAVLLVCMAMTAAVACQFHAIPPDYGRTTSTGHHHTPSAHASMDVACLTAVLPAVVFFLSLLSGLFHIASLFSYDALLAFPPFRPPRAVAR